MALRQIVTYGLARRLDEIPLSGYRPGGLVPDVLPDTRQPAGGAGGAKGSYPRSRGVAASLTCGDEALDRAAASQPSTRPTTGVILRVDRQLAPIPLSANGFPAKRKLLTSPKPFLNLLCVTSLRGASPWCRGFCDQEMPMCKAQAATELSRTDRDSIAGRLVPSGDTMGRCP